MICPLKCGVHGALLMRCQSERPLKRSAFRCAVRLQVVAVNR